MSVSSTRALIRAILLASSGFANVAAAQSYSIPEPPMRSTTDGNGVDLAKGQFAISETDLSIGPQGAGGLAHTRFWSAQTTGSGWRHSYLLAIANRLNGLTINLGDHSVAFTGSGSSYTSDQADGSQLTVSGNIYTYTGRDGTIITFDSSIIVQKATYYGPVIAVATSILKPDGEKQTLTYYQDGYDKPIPGDTVYTGLARLQSVTSTTGYQLYYAYASDNPNATDDWYRITQVTAINGSIDYCASLTNPCASSGARVTYSTSVSGSSTLETVVDPQGRTKVYTTDTATRRMLTVQRPTGGTLTFGYGSDKRIAIVLNGVANWNYTWSLSGKTLTGTVTQPLSQQRIVTADSTTNSILTDRDGLGYTTTRNYDTAGRQISITAPEGNALSFIYDSRGNITQQTAVAKSGSGLANITTYATFDSTCTNIKTCNQPNSTTDPRGNVTTYSYDPNHGGVVTTTAPAAQNGVHPQTRFGYSQLSAYYQTNNGLAAGAPIYKLTSTSTCQTAASCSGTADEVVSTVGYGTPGAPNTLLPTTATKAAGDGSVVATTTMTYDYAGNMIASDGPLPGAADTTSYAYNADRQVTQVTNPDPDGGGPFKSSAVAYGYNPDGQVTNVVSGSANADGSGFVSMLETVTVYDALGRKTQESKAGGGTVYAVSQYSYDALGRIDCVAQRMNPATFGSSPGACALGTSGSFGPDRIARTGYNDANEPTSAITGYGTINQRTEAATYTPNGKTATTTDANGNLAALTYDGFDRLTKTTYPSPRTAGQANANDFESYGYDAAGNRTNFRKRDGRPLTFLYDGLNRLINKSMAGGCAPIQVGACPPASATRGVVYDYDLRGLLTYARFDGPNGEGVTSTYDALGRLTSSTTAMSGTSRTLSYLYDAAGNRTQVMHPDGVHFDMSYDSASQMKNATWYAPATGTVPFVAIQYDNLGRRIDINRASSNTGYFWDGLGQQLGSTNQRFANAGFTESYSYNPASQVTLRSRDSDDYAYTGSVAVNRPYVPNGLNQYTTAGPATFTYDANGNLISDGTNSYVYDAENRMVVSSANGVALTYDPLGRLWSTASGALGTTQFLTDGDHVVVEYDGSNGSIRRRFMWGPGADEPIVDDAGGQMNCSGTRFLHTNYLGSVVALADCWGSRYAINGYDEFGVPNANNYGRYQYTGQAWLADVGMYYYKARMYSPTLGRFMQTDPIGYQGGLNIYNYAGSDPINETDPKGANPALAAEIVISAAPYVFPTIQVVAGAIATTVTALFNGIFGGIFGGGHPPQPPKNANAEQPSQQNPSQLLSCGLQIADTLSGLSKFGVTGKPLGLPPYGLQGKTVTSTFYGSASKMSGYFNFLTNTAGDSAAIPNPFALGMRSLPSGITFRYSLSANDYRIDVPMGALGSPQDGFLNRPESLHRNGEQCPVSSSPS